MKTRQLALNSVMSAMCAVLGFFSFDFGNIKVTLESLPVIIGAAMFGPLDGLAIGFVGTLISQLIRYGLSATTLLWMLPYCICGLVVGLYAGSKDFDMNKKQAIFAVIVAELLITTVNTVALYVDSKIYGYYFEGYITLALIPRYLISVVKAIVIGAVLPKILSFLKKQSLKDKAQGLAETP